MMRTQEEILFDLYLYAKKERNFKLANACRRDRNRLIQGLPIIYSRIHGLQAPKFKFEPDPVKDVSYTVDVVKGGVRQTTQERIL